MSAKILSGTELAGKIKKQLKEEVLLMKNQGVHPGLAVVIVGDDPASRVYVNFKKKDCSEIGIESFEYALSEKTSEEELISLIKKLNGDPKVNGILVQLPLPKHINEDKIIFEIDPMKDADCFHPVMLGN